MKDLIFAMIAGLLLVVGMSAIAAAVVLVRYFQLRRAGYKVEWKDQP